MNVVCFRNFSIMVYSVLEDDSKEFHGSIVAGTHTVGLCGIEVDAVSRIKHECLLADGQFETTLGDEVELLSLLGVVLQRMIIWLRLDSHHKGVGSTSAESAGKTLILILLSALHTHALALAGEEIMTHVWLFAKEKYIEGNAVFLGNLL